MRGARRETRDVNWVVESLGGLVVVPPVSDNKVVDFNRAKLGWQDIEAAQVVENVRSLLSGEGPLDGRHLNALGDTIVCVKVPPLVQLLQDLRVPLARECAFAY